MLYSTRPTIVKLTKAQYDALDPADKNNDTIYFITDVNGNGQSFQPVICSEEEQEIGVWINGKPLYKRTIVKSFDDRSTTLTISFSDYSVEGIFDYSIMLKASDSTSWVIPGYDTGGNVKITSFNIISCNLSRSNGNAWGNTPTVYLTIYYSKTDDTAGSGQWTPQGVPAIHYSEEEQVVGTWINGKTLYARTFVNENLTKSAVSSYDVYTVGTFDINAEMAFFITGALYETNDQRYFTLPYERSYSSTQKVYQELYTDATGKLYILASSIRSSGFNFSKAYITAYYTKRS